MTITLQKSSLHQILLAICIGVPYLGNYELTFLVWCFTLAITLQKSYAKVLYGYVACFLLILLVAFFSTDYEHGNLFFMVRDVTYLLKPAIGLVLGYQLCRHNYKDAFKTLAYIGLGVSIIHLMAILITFVRFFHISVELIRHYCGYFSDFEVYALVIVLFHKEFGINFPKKRFYLMASTIGLSAFLYLARTNFIQFIVLFMAMKGFLVLNRRAIMAIVTVVVVTLIAYTAILYVNPRRNGEGFESFLYKVKMAPMEPFQSKVNTKDYKKWNDNYRSVERILTVQQMEAKGTATVIFGKGLGSQVDLRQKTHFLDSSMRYISVLHNSFMTVFLKSGILGMILLVYSIILMFRQGKSSIPINVMVNRLLIGTALFLIISNWVLMGLYFTEDSKSLLIGFLIAYKVITHKRHAETISVSEGNPE
jgi:hypothetical protein